MNSPVSYIGESPLHAQWREIEVRARILASLNAQPEREEKETFDMDDEPIII